MQDRSTNLMMGLATVGVLATSGFVFRSVFRSAFRSVRLPKRRIVVITGGSSGLGLALAGCYGLSGAQLVLAARSADDLNRAREFLIDSYVIDSNDDALLISVDLKEAKDAQYLIDSAIAQFGRIDVLINNAGIIEVGPVEDQPLDAYERAMQTNFFGALHTTLAALPHMLKAGGGSIVNIASIGGKVGVPHLLPYVASKFALVGFSQGLHAEMRQKGISVTTVCPGLMRTGSHVRANFVGDQQKERRWFNLAATTPFVSASVHRAAKKIFRAQVDGRTEITITPHAWFAARFAGLAPETTQFLSSLANRFVLPDPLTHPAS